MIEKKLKALTSAYISEINAYWLDVMVKGAPDVPMLVVKFDTRSLELAAMSLALTTPDVMVALLGGLPKTLVQRVEFPMTIR